jgi:cation transport ATPase
MTSSTCQSFSGWPFFTRAWDSLLNRSPNMFTLIGTGVGAAYAYGLAVAGEAGITRALEILRIDLERTLRLLGCPSVAALDRSYVNVPLSWQA